MDIIDRINNIIKHWKYKGYIIFKNSIVKISDGYDKEEWELTQEDFDIIFRTYLYVKDNFKKSEKKYTDIYRLIQNVKFNIKAYHDTKSIKISIGHFIFAMSLAEFKFYIRKIEDILMVCFNVDEKTLVEYDDDEYWLDE